MNRLTKHLSAAAALATLAACTAAGPGPLSRPATAQDILVSVANAEQGRLWRDALAAGTVPPVAAITVPADPVRSVQVTQAKDTQRPRAPVLPEAVVTAVAPVALPDAGGFYGRAEVVEAAPERLVLLTERGDRLEIAYRRPSRGAVARLKPSEAAVVETLPLLATGPAQRYAIAIGDAQQAVALVAVLESSDTPITREFRTGQVRVRQVMDAKLRRLAANPSAIPPGGAAVPVEITIDGKTSVFSPGTITGQKENGVPYEIVVYDSLMLPADAAQYDAAPFTLHVAIFAAEDVPR